MAVRTTTEIGIEFTVDSRLLAELGERLVARRSVALAELIKNAYDADATSVTVKLLNVTKPQGTIVVEDNGRGMTLDDFRRGWMRIATDDKERNPVSPIYKRPRTGSKGIGRFACHRLATRLRIETTAFTNGLGQRLIAEFDWARFKSGEDVGSVSVPVRTVVVSHNSHSGTTLELVNTRGTWTEQDVAQLRRDLIGLVSPFPPDLVRAGQEKKDPGFSITLVCPEFPKYEGQMAEQFLSHAWGTLTGTIHANGRPSYHLRLRTGPTSRFSPPSTFSQVGQARFEIGFFVYKASLFKGLDVSLAEARKMGRESGGVRVYRDGFRVFGYGEPGDDWLDLDADRGKRLVTLPEELQAEAEGLPRPMLLLPGNNQLFGLVSISREANSNLIVSMSRERLVQNDAFRQLKRFVRLGIDWMTVEYARWSSEERAARRRPTPSTPLEAVDTAISIVNEATSVDTGTRSKVTRSLRAARAAILSADRDVIEERTLLQILASAGNMVLIFNHEISALLDDLNSILQALRKLSTELRPKQEKALQEMAERLGSWVEMVEQQGEQLGLLLGKEGRSERRRLAVREIVDELENSFTRYMSEEGVEFRNAVPSNLRTPPMFSAELYSILVNVLTNALKAVKGRKLARIEVAGSRDNHDTIILFKDTGIGIAANMREEVFKPFVSTSVPDPLLGAGTGLGLKIVRDIATKYGGTAKFIHPKKPWRACVEIRLPEAWH